MGKHARNLERIADSRTRRQEQTGRREDVHEHNDEKPLARSEVLSVRQQ